MGLFSQAGLEILEMLFGFRTKCCMEVWALGVQGRVACAP